MITINRYILLSILIFLSNPLVYSQDTIVRKNGEHIISKVLEIRTNEISYKKYTNIEGPTYVLNISKVSRIKFKNGTEELFDSSSEHIKMSLEETKKFLKENIDLYCYEAGAGKWSVIIEFEGEFMRIYWISKNPNNTKKPRKLDLYDFSKKCTFQRVSKRKNDVAFINIVLPKLLKRPKNTWNNEEKLVLRVQGHDKAEEILNAMKHYHNLLYIE